MTDSLTNLEAVKPRGPKIFAGILAIVVLGAAAWFVWGREPGPIGEPEDASKLLIVDDAHDAAGMIPQLGFEVETGSLEGLAQRGREEGAGDFSSDIDAVLHLADVSGHGYVVFSDPSSLDFGSRPVAADSDDVQPHHRYAVFSVGTFATPNPKVTVDQSAQQPYGLPAYAELLRALFEQDKLAATLIGKSNLSMEAQPLYEKIRHAVKLKGAYALVDQRAKGLLARAEANLVEKEEAQPKPTRITQPLARGRARALANGWTLLFVRAATVQHPLDERAALHWPEQPKTFAENPTTQQRVRCPELDAWGTALRIDYNASGTAAVVRGDEGPPELYTLDAKTPGCGFTLQGTFDPSVARGADLSPKGRAAQLVSTDEAVVLEIYEAGEHAPQTWPLAGCSYASTPAWLDDVRVATVCTFSPPDEPDEPLDSDTEPQEPQESAWMYVVDTAAAQTFALPLSTSRRSSSVLPRFGNGARVLLRDSWPRSMTAIDFTASSWGALAKAPPLHPTLQRPPFVLDASAGIVALDPEAITQREIVWEEQGTDLVVSPDGESVTMQVDYIQNEGRNIAVLSLADGRFERIATNARVQHFHPHFTADGKHVVFNSFYDDRDDRIEVPQIAAVPSKG